MLDHIEGSALTAIREFDDSRSRPCDLANLSKVRREARSELSGVRCVASSIESELRCPEPPGPITSSELQRYMIGQTFVSARFSVPIRSIENTLPPTFVRCPRGVRLLLLLLISTFPPPVTRCSRAPVGPRRSHNIVAEKSVPASVVLSTAHVSGISSSSIVSARRWREALLIVPREPLSNATLDSQVGRGDAFFFVGRDFCVVATFRSEALAPSGSRGRECPRARNRLASASSAKTCAPFLAMPR